MKYNYYFFTTLKKLNKLNKNIDKNYHQNKKIKGQKEES